MSAWDDGIQNALVSSARIELNDHGLLDVWLMLEYGIGGQGFGGWSLGRHVFKPADARQEFLESKHNYAGHYLIRVMQVCGVHEFAHIPGRSLRVAKGNGLIRGIGHITKDDWFYPSRDFAPEFDHA